VRRAQRLEPRFTVAHVGRDEDGGATWRPGDGDVVDRAAPAGAGLIADGSGSGKAGAEAVLARLARAQPAQQALAAAGRERPLPDGRLQVAGGWNRLQLEVPDVAVELARLRAAGVSSRTGEVVAGPGGAQVVLDDPSGNPVELFQPRK